MKLKYPFLTGLLALVTLAALLFRVHLVTGPAAVALLVSGQLVMFALSKPRALAFYMAALSPEQVREFEEIMEELKTDFKAVKDLLPQFDELRKEVNRLKKSTLSGGTTGVRWIGNVPFVTDDCAKAITSVFVVEVAGLKNGLESMIPDDSRRKQLLAFAQSNLGIPSTQRAGGALTSGDIPLPTVYVPQVVELVFAFGAARQYATVFPLGNGTVKLPRLQAGEDTFGFLGAGTAGMSSNIPQKEVTAQLVTFTANKMGGLIRIPYELEEDTFIPIGQFLARYIARQFAKLEDNTLFNADGTGTYANIVGIAKYCQTNPAYLQTLNAGQTVVTDATINQFRALRALVNPAILFNMAASGQTQAAYYIGDLTYWYLGERGAPRIEVSKEVFFQTDELAMRALERIDVEAMAVDAMACLQTPAQ